MKLALFGIAMACLVSAQPGAAPKANLDFSAIALQADSARDAGRFEEAEGLYKKALAIRPTWVEGQWSLATVNYEQKKFVACRDQLRRLFVKNRPGSIPMALLGLCEFQTKEYPQALNRLFAARQMGLPTDHPLTKQSVVTEAMLWTKSGDFERALATYPIITKLGADSPQMVISAGLTALRKAQFPEEMDPDYRELVIKLGRAMLLAADRRAADARPILEELVSEYPGVANLHYTFASFLLGADVPRALDAFETELKLQPNHLPSLVTLAIEYLKAGDPNRARTYAERAIKVAPGNFAARTAMGRVYSDLDQIPQAIRELELAVKLAPDSPQTRFALAGAYAKAGRTQDAARERAAFQKLKEIATPTDVK